MFLLSSIRRSSLLVFYEDYFVTTQASRTVQNLILEQTKYHFKAFLDLEFKTLLRKS